MDYTITLDETEAKTLAWLAARYETAAILYAHEDEGVIALPESEAWRYMDELAEENGNPAQVVPTCVGGTLADKLITFYNSII